MSDAKTEGASGSSLNVPRRTPDQIADLWIATLKRVTGMPISEEAMRDTYMRCAREAQREALEEAARLAEAGPVYRWAKLAIAHGIRSLINEEPRRQAPPDALAQARSEVRAASLEELGRAVEEGAESSCWKFVR